jgi:hypothetical protein
MADILGQQPKVDLKQAKEMVCTSDECDGSVFIQGTKFLKLSRIATGQAKDAIIPVELYLCGDCGKSNYFRTKSRLLGNFRRWR